MENKVEEPALQYNFYSLQEYWEIEESTENKNEYYNGNLVVMQGASLNHNQIVMNLAGNLSSKVKSNDCKMFVNDLRLSISSANAYVYPDAMIICGEPELTEDKFDTVKNPSVIFEVISKSTEANDRRKFFYYMQMANVKEIIMINSYELVKVEVGVKQENGSWQITTYTSLQDEIKLSVIDEQISLADIYENVSF
ncbi:Uma2 family endonuclease [Ferruginibacter sp. SUN106]|uniref:Uma2 family endonuclease n=1 Tax=Ferruginibacter sp. SUN106 TaxID=2978348 RepID=UPI003D35BF28